MLDEKSELIEKWVRQINYLSNTARAYTQILEQLQCNAYASPRLPFLLCYGFFYRGHSGMAPDRDVAEFHALLSSEP